MRNIRAAPKGRIHVPRKRYSCRGHLTRTEGRDGAATAGEGRRDQAILLKRGRRPATFSHDGDAPSHAASPRVRCAAVRGRAAGAVQVSLFLAWRAGERSLRLTQPWPHWLFSMKYCLRFAPLPTNDIGQCFPRNNDRLKTPDLPHSPHAWPRWFVGSICIVPGGKASSSAITRAR